MQSPLMDFLPTTRRGSADSSQSFETAASSHQYMRATPSSDPVFMARLNALNLSSVPTRTPTKHPNVNSPTSPLSSRSPSLPRRFSSCHASTSSTSDKRLSTSSSSTAMHHLPPLSPLSSMYDPNSRSASASEEDASCSSSASSDTEPASLMHTRSMCDHRLRGNLLRGEVVNGAGGNALNAPHHHTPHNQTPFRKAFSQRNPTTANLPTALRHRFSLDHPSDPSTQVQHDLRARSESLTRNFDMPRGKVQHLPPSVPRPATPSRLPRPKVFIRQNSSRSSVVDAAAVKHVPSACGGDFLEPQLVTREIPFSPSQHFAIAYEQQQQQQNALVPTTPQFSAKLTNVAEEQMYFSDDDEFDSQLVDPAKSPFTHNSPSDALSTKVRRAVSALRSISFQSNQIEDFDTAWGQTLSVSQEKQNPSFASLASAKWRRARGKVTNRATGKQFECYSENDACSLRSSGSNVSQRDRSVNSHNHIRGFAAMRMRANFGGPHKRSLWAGARRDRQQPHAVAAQLLVSGGGHGFLAASTDLAEQRQALATVSPSDAVEARNSNQRGSVDKYVEFIHASAQRETKGRFGPRNFPSRVLRLFRRKWN